MARTALNVVADCLWEERSTTRDLLWVSTFSLLTALLAQVRVPLPFTPVPITGQTFAVLLSGAVMGSRRAFASQVIYLGAGAAGLPVFAGGAASFAHLFGPTGGYLWSYPAAAGLLGWLVERGASRNTGKLALALVFSDLIILISGTLWLRSFLDIPYQQALNFGLYPFLFGDTLKVVLVGAFLPRILKRFSIGGRRE